MSKVITKLENSTDPLEVDLADTLKSWQNAKRLRGERATLGYEPRDINSLGAVEMITRRVRSQSSGFNEVGVEDSYESIVDKHSHRFPEDIVTIARERIKQERVRFQPTANKREFFEQVGVLRARKSLDQPEGSAHPDRIKSNVMQYARDPKVAAWVLRLANGHCELCGGYAPFLDRKGLPFLEIHHVKPLSEGGSDLLSNVVALCPNCHRAVHLAANGPEYTARLYEKVQRLTNE
ncbi:MAG: HNH endonuclease signature motif containing protein [Caldilineaceae bacterium]